MPLHPQNYHSLTSQVVQSIIQGIAQKTWVNWLPGERLLADTLQVSRKTIRKALVVLRQEGRIETIHGLGHHIIKGQAESPSSPGPEMTVGLLAPEPLEKLRPFTALWVDELRDLLVGKGIRFEILSGRRYFSRRPDKALDRLVSQSPHTCWVLAQSNAQVQQWFQQNRLACVIAGSSHPGLDLPSVDLDYFAVCRHAAGAMLRHGHRRLGLLTTDSQRAGDIESEAGFSSGASQPGYGEVSPLIMRHDGTVVSINRMLARMFDQTHPPTALLISSPAYYLTTVSFLAQRRLRVPQDVSLICRDDDVFLSFLNPLPARYVTAPRSFAKRLMQPLGFQLNKGSAKHASFRIEPKFIPAPSLANIIPTTSS